MLSEAGGRDVCFLAASMWTLVAANYDGQHGMKAPAGSSLRPGSVRRYHVVWTGSAQLWVRLILCLSPWHAIIKVRFLPTYPETTFQWFPVWFPGTLENTEVLTAGQCFKGNHSTSHLTDRGNTVTFGNTRLWRYQSTRRRKFQKWEVMVVWWRNCWEEM